jgi:acyl-CoA synthetase (NDP forming)
LHLSEDLQTEGGSLGLICQSGTVSTYLCRVAPLRGAAISKAVSYGNACDLDEADLLDYLADDSETKVIGVYIEGVKDGERFKKALEKAAKAKPTIILKGGKTEVGAMMAASHTGVLASSMKAWDALVKQSGAIPVDTIDEIIDLALLFIHTKPPKGRRLGMVGIGGGVSVLATDYFGGLNLTFPRLPDEVKAQLQSMAPAAGAIYNNPVDTPLFFVNPDAYSKLLNTFDEWDGVDMMLLHLGYDVLGGSRDYTGWVFDVLLNGAKTVKKPTSLLLNYVSLPKSYTDYIEDQRKAYKEGIPAFSMMESAAKAINRFIGYHERKP